MKTEQINIQELTEKHVAFVSFTGNFMGNSQVFADLFHKLCGWAGPKGFIGPNTQFLSSYPDDPNVTAPDEMRLDVCMSISEDTAVDGDVQKKTLPGGRYAVMHAELTGPEEYGLAWEKLVAWAEQNGCEVDMSRPSYEFYFNNPEEHPQKHHILDLCLSIKMNG